MTLPGWALALALLGASTTLGPTLAMSQEDSARKPAKSQPASKSRKKTAGPQRSLEDRLKDVADVPALFVQCEGLPCEGLTKDLAEYVQYNLKLAIRAGYDVDVFVPGMEIRDQKTRLFKVRNGVASNEPAEYQFERSQVVEVQRHGMLVARTPEEAFALGLRFFLTDARIEGKSLQYTMVSNPRYEGAQGATYVETINRRTGTKQRVLNWLDIKWDPKPQTGRVGIGNLDDQTTGRVTIFALPRGTRMPYVDSNDIDLAAVWKSRSQ